MSSPTPPISISFKKSCLQIKIKKVRHKIYIYTYAYVYMYKYNKNINVLFKTYRKKEMLKLLNKYTLIALVISSCCAELYQWNVKTVEKQPHDHNVAIGEKTESDTDFGDELKVQSALNNQLQRDLLKISGKANKNSNRNKNLILYDNHLNKYENNVHKDMYVAEAAEGEAMKEQQDYRKEDQFDNQYVRSSTEKITDGELKFDQYLQNINGNNNDLDNSQNVQWYPSRVSKEDTYQYNLPTLNENLLNMNENNKERKQTDSHKSYLQKTMWKKKDEHSYDVEEDIDIQPYERNNKKDNKLNNHCLKANAYIHNFLGSNLFGNTPKKCFSKEDIKTLIMRRDFEVIKYIGVSYRKLSAVRNKRVF